MQVDFLALYRAGSSDYFSLKELKGTDGKTSGEITFQKPKDETNGDPRLPAVAGEYVLKYLDGTTKQVKQEKTFRVEKCDSLEIKGGDTQKEATDGIKVDSANKLETMEEKKETKNDGVIASVKVPADAGAAKSGTGLDSSASTATATTTTITAGDKVTTEVKPEEKSPVKMEDKASGNKDAYTRSSIAGASGQLTDNTALQPTAVLPSSAALKLDGTAAATKDAGTNSLIPSASEKLMGDSKAVQQSTVGTSGASVKAEDAAAPAKEADVKSSISSAVSQVMGGQALEPPAPGAPASVASDVTVTLKDAATKGEAKIGGLLSGLNMKVFAGTLDPTTLGADTSTSAGSSKGKTVDAIGKPTEPADGPALKSSAPAAVEVSVGKANSTAAASEKSTSGVQKEEKKEEKKDGGIFGNFNIFGSKKDETKLVGEKVKEGEQTDADKKNVASTTVAKPAVDALSTTISPDAAKSAENAGVKIGIPVAGSVLSSTSGDVVPKTQDVLASTAGGVGIPAKGSVLSSASAATAPTTVIPTANAVSAVPPVAETKNANSMDSVKTGAVAQDAVAQGAVAQGASGKSEPPVDNAAAPAQTDKQVDNAAGPTSVSASGPGALPLAGSVKTGADAQGAVAQGASDKSKPPADNAAAPAQAVKLVDNAAGSTSVSASVLGALPLAGQKEKEETTEAPTAVKKEVVLDGGATGLPGDKVEAPKISGDIIKTVDVAMTKVIDGAKSLVGEAAGAGSAASKTGMTTESSILPSSAASSTVVEKKDQVDPMPKDDPGKATQPESAASGTGTGKDRSKETPGASGDSDSKDPLAKARQQALAKDWGAAEQKGNVGGVTGGGSANPNSPEASGPPGRDKNSPASGTDDAWGAGGSGIGKITKTQEQWINGPRSSGALAARDQVGKEPVDTFGRGNRQGESVRDPAIVEAPVASSSASKGSHMQEKEGTIDLKSQSDISPSNEKSQKVDANKEGGTKDAERAGKEDTREVTEAEHRGKDGRDESRGGGSEEGVGTGGQKNSGRGGAAKSGGGMAGVFAIAGVCVRAWVCMWSALQYSHTHTHEHAHR